MLNVEPFIPNRDRLLRSKDICDCYICQVAKAFGLAAKKMKKKKGRPSKSGSLIAGSSATLNKSATMCTECLTELYQGCNHQCSKTTKIQNIEKFLESPTKSTSKRLINREKRKYPSDHQQQKVISISGESLSTIGTNMDLSIRKTKELAQNLRSTTGCRGIVQPYSIAKVQDDRHRLDEFFVNETMFFVQEDKGNIQKFHEHAVVCNNLNGLIDEVIRHRNIQVSDMFIRIGLDGGGGFFKLCLSIFDVNSPESVITKAAKKYKDTGVKKVLLIAISPGIQENYINVKKIWLETKIHQLKYKYMIATDLKLINIILGLQNHSSLHPCPWCEANKYNLQNKGKQRTFASLLEHYFNFYDANVGKEVAKDYGNVIHPPILDVEDKNTPVIHHVPPPELHLMMGPTNHLIDALCKVWPGCIAWLQSLNLYEVDYFGGKYEGDDCRKILRKISIITESFPPHVSQLVHTIKLFNDVVNACFGYNLSKDFVNKINEFKRSYLRLNNVSVTPKVHAVIHHIPEFCLFTGRGLGPYSEQTVEAVHSDFKKCWGNFQVKRTDHPKYGERFLRAVQSYNSTHV